MQIEIHHHATCGLGGAASLAPQTLRLRPRTDGRQWLDSFEMSIDPKPESLDHVIDAEGNIVTIVRPGADVAQFEIFVRSRVQTLPTIPMESDRPGDGTTLPYSYPEALKWLLAPARHRSMRRSDDDPVHDFAERLRRTSDNPIGFLNRLARMVADQFEHAPEPKAEQLSGMETLLNRRGTSGELAALFMEAARAMGLATRFVSGYHVGEGELLEAGTHAWAEVYLPSAGWIGFDPTLGYSVGERHIALAAAADPRNATSCGGCFEQVTGLALQSTVAVLELGGANSPLVSTKRRRN